jgi:hypothetical protein
MRDVTLTQGQVALVPDGDHDWLSSSKWYAKWNSYTKSFYAFSAVPTGLEHPKQQWIRMHNAIWEHHNGPIPVGRTVDHVGHDTLDNRLSNLRLATNSQQAQNRRLRTDNKSGYRGVHWHKATGKWTASIQVNGKRMHLGLFTDKIEAARAYDAAAAIHHDPAFVQFNFPEEHQ